MKYYKILDQNNNVIATMEIDGSKNLIQEVLNALKPYKPIEISKKEYEKLTIELELEQLNKIHMLLKGDLNGQSTTTQ